MSLSGANVAESSKSASTTAHVFEVEALNLHRLSISFEVEEDNDFDGLEEDEELMRQLDEEMVETMSGEAGGLVSAEINLKVSLQFPVTGIFALVFAFPFSRGLLVVSLTPSGFIPACTRFFVLRAGNGSSDVRLGRQRGFVSSSHYRVRHQSS